MRTETGEVINSSEVTAGSSTGDVEGGNLRNNYSRPEGQNVGNFLSDRPSSRVLAAPGGASSIVFGSDEPAAPAPRSGRAPGSLAPASDHHMSSNNYARPDGQNCGNFLTDRKVGALSCTQCNPHASGKPNLQSGSSVSRSLLMLGGKG
jgi:SPIRAL1-like protein